MKIEFTATEYETMLSSLLYETEQILDILYEEKHNPAGEDFVIMLERLNELSALYIKLNYCAEKYKETK